MGGEALSEGYDGLAQPQTSSVNFFAPNIQPGGYSGLGQRVGMDQDQPAAEKMGFEPYEKIELLTLGKATGSRPS